MLIDNCVKCFFLRLRFEIQMKLDGKNINFLTKRIEFKFEMKFIYKLFLFFSQLNEILLQVVVVIKNYGW